MRDFNRTPLVSICIPLYNAEKYLFETLERLSEQSYPNIEVIVVDDHSTDNSLEIAASYPKGNIKVLTNPGKGACAARNLAFAHANGEFIKFLDADDYCTPRLIERQVEALLGASQHTVAFSPLRLLFPDGTLIDPDRKIDQDFDDAFDLQIQIMAGGGTNVPHCYLIPRALAEAVGGWDESVRKNQDGEYFSRVLALADKALSIKEEAAIYRKTGAGLSTKTSVDAVISVFHTYKKIMQLALSKNNTDAMRLICGRWFGLFVFINYPQLKSTISDVEKICRLNNIPLQMPERRIYKLLRIIFGWKNAISIMHIFGMIGRVQ